MIRTFIQERASKWDELLQIDTESGKVKIYTVDKELDFPFSEYYTTVVEMGYKSIKEMIDTMKRKDNKKEIDTEEQTQKEINGLLKLAKHRAEHNNHTCMILKDGTKYNDIVERLKAYGMTEAEAVKKIDDFLNLLTFEQLENGKNYIAIGDNGREYDATAKIIDGRMIVFCCCPHDVDLIAYREVV